MLELPSITDNAPVIVIRNDFQYAVALEMIKMLWLAQPGPMNEAVILAIEEAAEIYENRQANISEEDIDRDFAWMGTWAEPQKH